MAGELVLLGSELEAHSLSLDSYTKGAKKRTVIITRFISDRSLALLHFNKIKE